MKSTLDTNTTTAKEYRWKDDGTDGLRSYSYNASDESWNYSSEPDDSNKNKDGAYLFTDSSTGQPSARRGNLYNMTAVTLGSSLGITDRQASDSICPRGWQPPIITVDMKVSVADMTGKSLAKLLKTYSLSQISGNDAASYNKLNSWPLQFLRTGLYLHYGGYVAARTADGGWWSGATYAAARGYYLYSWPDYVNAQDSWSRGYGYALRK